MSIILVDVRLRTPLTYSDAADELRLNPSVRQVSHLISLAVNLPPVAHEARSRRTAEEPGLITKTPLEGK